LEGLIPWQGNQTEPNARGMALLGNPFAILGVTPRTPVDELFDRADTPDAATAARALSVPRSRLAAEASFLPGVSDAATGILAALRAGRRVDPAGLPPLAAANLRAHLCAAGLATGDDVAALASSMPAGADAALVAAIDADRAVAGMPPCQQAALAEEIEALTDSHAAALVTACEAGADPAGQLAGLIEDGPAPPSPILRRAAAAWIRRRASALAGLQADANAAVGAWQARPDANTWSEFERTVRSWAALSRPQRLVDARAGLDHPPAVRALAPWRASIRQLAQSGQDKAALPAAQLLATCLGDLPSVAAALQGEARSIAALGEVQALAPHLTRLNEVVARLTADPAPLRAGLATRGFGPAARKDAGALWAAFDAAASASTVSEAPWEAVAPIAGMLDIPNRAGGAAAAVALFTGLIGRAEAAGRAELAARLRTRLRAHQATAALQVYARRTRKRWVPWFLAPVRRWRVAAAIDRALLLVDDPAERRKLEAHRATLRSRSRLFWITGGVTLAVLGLGSGIGQLDEQYAATAPYRQHPPISLAVPVLPVAPALPFALAPLMPSLNGLTFPAHPGEHAPDLAAPRLGRAELRWCLANAVRIYAASAAAGPGDHAGLSALSAQLSERCEGKTARRLDEDAVRADVEANQDRLRVEGEAMLGPSPP
jgi:hypothetical protein